MAAPTSAIAEAYRTCRQISRQHYENFPVASRLVPREKRDALAAIYAFARTADDFADEPSDAGLTQAARLQALASWRTQLLRCFQGEASHPVFLALGDAARRWRLSLKHFEDLLCAFEMDVRQNQHQNFDSLLKYCSCSANPIGRLVLELFDHRDPERFALADQLTTALQLANFWQDVSRDLDRGHVYLPLEDLQRFDLSVEHLKAFQATSDTEGWDRWEQLMAFEISRTKTILESGRPLAEEVTPSLRRQLRLTWLGGAAVLSRIEATGYDVFRRNPRLSALDFVCLYYRSRRPVEPHLKATGAAMTPRL